MLSRTGTVLADRLKRWIPDPFVFAVLLTLLTGLLALVWGEASALDVIDAWYGGFWRLLAFGMQITLILATGFAIALSPPAARFIDLLARRIDSPRAVYATVMLVGSALCLVSWGWTVLTAVLARELAKRVKGVDYSYLVACAYISGQSWVCGLSSSIPLVLNTENNFLIQAGILEQTLPTTATLLSPLNLVMALCFLTVGPVMMVLLRPRERVTDIDAMVDPYRKETTGSVAEEADSERLPGGSISDRLNHSAILQLIVAAMGFVYIGKHFFTRGFDLGLNIMIFTFLMLGLVVHRTPMRYVIAMKRACANISGIVFQYPFYAGIMGIMVGTALGGSIASWVAGAANPGSLPFFSFVSGGAINFSIPSAGGEWAVVGPTVVTTAQELGAGLDAAGLESYISRNAMAVAYGESLTNLLQPFFLLVILPVLGAGVRIQARDVMGYLVLPFCVFFVIEALLITWIPM